LEEGRIVRASKLKLNDHFKCGGATYVHLGWYSAVDHIVAVNLENGEQTVISCHEDVVKVEDKDV
jgi:hypothetical protein